MFYCFIWCLLLLRNRCVSSGFAHNGLGQWGSEVGRGLVVPWAPLLRYTLILVLFMSLVHQWLGQDELLLFLWFNWCSSWRVLLLLFLWCFAVVLLPLQLFCVCFSCCFAVVFHGCFHVDLGVAAFSLFLRLFFACLLCCCVFCLSCWCYSCCCFVAVLSFLLLFLGLHFV